MNYQIEDYSLELSGDYKALKVTDRQTGNTYVTFDLTLSSYKVKVEEGEYRINAGNVSNPCHSQGFDVLTGDSFSFDFNGAKTHAGGFGIIDIRDINREGATISVDAEITYFLDQCSIDIQYISGIPKNFVVKTACAGSSCVEPSSECWNYTEQ